MSLKVLGTELAVGDYITVNAQERKVTAIASDTTLTVGSSFNSNFGPGVYTTRNFYAAGSTCTVADNMTDVTGGVNLVPDATKHASWTRIFQDELTGLDFTNVLSTGATWTVATDACVALNGGTGGSGWHLPTQKELTQLYIDGISRMGSTAQSAFGSTGSAFWSSSIYSTIASYAFFFVTERPERDYQR